MTNSRLKGKRGELELARLLQSYGVPARRGQQYSGSNGDADVVGLDGYHIECKRVERLNLYSAMEQSKRDAKPNERPIVCHRTDRKEWLVTLRLSDFVAICGSLVTDTRNEDTEHQ